MARRFDILINAQDNSSAVFKKAAAGITSFFAGRELVYGLKATIQNAAQFEHQMAAVSTMLKTNIGPQTKQFTEQIRRMSTEFGQSKETLSKGLYDILSAGVKASKSIDVLTGATKAAIGGVTDTAIAVDGATSVLNAYKLEADESTRVFDLMFNTVREGKITFEELSENISKLAPLANAAGMELEDMFAAIATAVKVEKPDRAMTALSAALATAAKNGKSLLQVVRELRGANLQQIFAAGFEKRSAQGIALLANNYEEFLNQLKLTRSATGSAEEAFQRMAKTTQHSLNQINQSWEDFKTSVGNFAIVTGQLDKLKGATEGLNQINREIEFGDSAAKKDALLRSGMGLIDSYMRTLTYPFHHGLWKPDTEAMLNNLGFSTSKPTTTKPVENAWDFSPKPVVDDLWSNLKREHAERQAAEKQFFDDLDAMSTGGIPKITDQLDTFFMDLKAMSSSAVDESILDKLPSQEDFTATTMANLLKSLPPGFKDIIPQGPQQAFVTRGLSGLGTNVRPQEQTAKNTKTTNDKLDNTNDKLDTLIAQGATASKSAVRLMPANLP